MSSVRKFAAHTAALTFVIATAVLVSFTPPANAVSYQTSGFSLSALGDTIGSPYDQLTGTSVSGAFVDGQTINLNWLTFTAGINATLPQDYNNMSISETMTIGNGPSQHISIPFNLSISYSDTLTVVNGTSFSLTDAGGTLWQVVVNGLTLGPNSGGPMSNWLTAQVTDPAPGVSQAPLPAALPLFASGLGGMGLLSWWRKRKRVGTRTAG